MDWVITLLLGILIGGGGVFLFLKTTSKNTFLKAKNTAARMLEDAQIEADTLKKEKVLEAEEEIFEQKQHLEQEYEKRLQQLSRTERELDQREIEVDRKVNLVAKKEREMLLLEQQMKEREQTARQKVEELQVAIRAQAQKLEEISGLSRQDARDMLLKEMEQEAHEEGQRITQTFLEQARLEAHRKAREIVVQAIQQISAEQSVEATVSVITLPDDDMKGRIIGREGRNIRAFELITGVDVIIDDTPEIVVLSSYNSYRREIARLSLEKLIHDGRIHPARIEEVVEKTTEELKESLHEVGEQALLDLGVHGVPQEVTEILGKLRYRTAYGQNVLNHSIEVANLCGIMAAELGLDARVARRAGILHDIGKGLESYTEADHAAIGADFLRKFNENPIVLNAVAAHHNEREASSPITLIVAAADRISGTRPGARRESLEGFIKRMQQLEDICKEFPGVDKAYAIQAGREVRVMVETDGVDDGKAREMAREIARNIQMKIEFPGQIKVTVIREYRAFDYAT